MFYTGESLHCRADLYGVRSAEDECYLLLSPSSKEPSFSWVLTLVMVLAAASSPSCITFTIHTPVQLWEPTCFVLPEQYGLSPHPQQSEEVISTVGRMWLYCRQSYVMGTAQTLSMKAKLDSTPWAWQSSGLFNLPEPQFP